MKFFNIDCHASVIADISNIFTALGHEVDDWSLSGHSWVMGKPKNEIKLNDGSAIIGGGVCNQDVCDKFYDTYKTQLNKYDAFICCYPVEFCMLYEKWNKPIIVVNCVRYEHPNTRNTTLWNRLNAFLLKWNDNGKLFYIANNKGDQYYSNYFLGITAEWIPNLCAYTNCSYVGHINKYLLQERSYSDNLSAELVMSISNLKDKNWRYMWKDVYDYKGIIHVPYHNGSMTIFENYTANMPMFMPSKNYGKKLFHEGKMFDDLTFYKIYNLPEPENIDNPNSIRNERILNMWFDTCDFYDPENMPHIVYFDSFVHLTSLLKETDTFSISANMKEFNKYRKNMIYEKWKKIIDKIK